MTRLFALPRSTVVVLAVLFGVLLGQVLPQSAPHALGQDRPLTLSSSCSDGDIVVADGGSRLRCVDPDDLRLRSCDDDELLGTDSSGRLRCVGPSSTPWGVRGLLPDCSSGDTLVSEGFGRWRCQSPSR